MIYTSNIFYSLPITLLFLIVTKTNAQWIAQNSSTDKNLHSVAFVDSLNGWIVGDSGIVLHTTDAGNHWFSQFSGIPAPLLSVSFSDKQNGWTTGSGGIILKTTNSGEAWISIYQDTSKNVRHFKVQSLTPQMAIVLRDSFEQDYWTNCRIWKTKDGGMSWQEISPRQNHFLAINDFYFTSELNGWASGHGIDNEGHDALQIHRTTDGGNTWNTCNFGAPTLWSVRKIYFIDSINGWAISDSLYRSIDGGFSWVGVCIPSFGDPNDFVMFGSIGYACEIGVGLEKTTDAGLTWSDQLSAFSKYFESISFISPKIGWAVGWNGQIVHTTNGGITSVEDGEQSAYHYVLIQNYPNPFNPSTIISFYACQTGFATIKIFDVLGREVQTLLNESIVAGLHKIQWNPVSIPSGIYFYQLHINSFIETKKLIFLK